MTNERRRACVLAMPGAEACAERLAAALGLARARLESRRFPDGEIYLRVADPVDGADVLLVAQLRDPDPQLPGLLFAADALRELGARRVGLVAPYLPYMRQDLRFRPGEAITSTSLARLLSGAFDWLATIDPHLHRHATLAALYRIPAIAGSAAPAIAAWLRAQVADPIVIGPDAESAQWVAEVARRAGCAHVVLSKQRHGDRDIVIDPDALPALQGRTPVLVDDIIASAHTLAGAVRALRGLGGAPPVCVGVHAIFAGDAAALLGDAGAARVVSCDTLVHPSNAIACTGALADAVRAARGVN